MPSEWIPHRPFDTFVKVLQLLEVVGQTVGYLRTDRAEGWTGTPFLSVVDHARQK
jgi:hypothetical protein